MSSESDSDIFFDAEESTPVRVQSEDLSEQLTEKVDQNETLKAEENSIELTQVNDEELKEAYRKAKDNEKRRKKVEEIRMQMLNEDDEVLEIHSEQSSIASSSVEGIYPKSSSSYVIKTRAPNPDTSSVVSLGKVGSILGGKDTGNSKEIDTISIDSKYSISGSESMREFAVPAVPNSRGCEPDVVASTKGETSQRPVAPPRKKKRKNIQQATSCGSIKSSSSQVLASSDPVESIAREIEYSLDLHSATQGLYVVKPQDREQDRAEGPGAENSSQRPALSRSESFNSVSSRGSQDAVELALSTKRGEENSKQEAYVVRTRSDSGRPLTDQEILAQVTVRNLDTGEQIPLSLAEEHLPKCLNPLSLHLMRLTSEYVSNSTLDKCMDEENSEMRKSDSLDLGGNLLKNVFHKSDLMKRIKVDVNRIRNAVDRGIDLVTHSRHTEEDGSEEESAPDHRPSVKIKVSSKLKSAEKGPNEFENISVLQEMSGEHTGAIWTMKFSCCGRLLATAGQDRDLRIWVLRDAFKYFDDMRHKYNMQATKSPEGKGSLEEKEKSSLEDENEQEETDDNGPFMSKPFSRYVGHTAEILDVSWSKNNFILSSSMDKTVRLWHISRKESLCCFQHIDFVTAIAFHPKDDRYFLSGSLDGKLRLWNIPDKKVTLWNELDGHTKLITALNFCQNGKMAIVGSYDGRCIFYYTEQLKYYTQIFVRSTKGKNAQGRKISGIEAMPGEDKILVTSNDSRIRLYDLRDLSLTCKYKGYLNLSSQIKASFSHDGKYIVSGSEDQFIYLWKTSHDSTKFRRDRNDYWTGVKAHTAVVTAAVFAPNPQLILKQLEQKSEDFPCPSIEHSANSYVMVSADFNGIIKVFLHRSKPITSSTS